MKAIRCLLSSAARCVHFKSGECMSPVKCKYQTELISVKFPETIFMPTKEAWEKMQAELARLTAENAELRERLNRAGGLPCKVGDTLYEPFIDRIREWIVDSIYVFSLGINVNCERKDDYGWHDCFVIRENYNDFESRIYLTREAAEAKRKEKEEKNND